MTKKWDYFHVDCGHFPVQIKLCFSNEDFQKVLLDHSIILKATALDEGVAETHYLTDGKQGIIVMAFDLDECEGEDPAILAGVIAHEATHCTCRVFEHIGEEPQEIGEESRAYLTEHIVVQITKAIEVQKERNARKTSRTVPKQTGKRSGRAQPKVDQHNNRRARQDRVPEPDDPPGRAQDNHWRVVSTTKNRLRTAR